MVSNSLYIFYRQKRQQTQKQQNRKQNIMQIATIHGFR